jgi:DNA-binding MarR family transcriptional regulator
MTARSDQLRELRRVPARGKYRLTVAQEYVLGLLAECARTAHDLVRACEQLDKGQVDAALKALDKMKLVTRTPLSDSRWLWQLTGEGRADALARWPK